MVLPASVWTAVPWLYAPPNGTLLACTFDPELVEELYEMEGMELRKNKIDSP